MNAAIQLKDDGSSNLQVRNAADSAYLKLLALDPLTTDAQGVVTVTYFNNNAPQTANAIKVLAIKTGNYGPTFQTAVTLPNKAVVTRCVVVVSVVLDVATTLTVGTDEAGQASRFMGTGDNDITATGTYETTPF